MDCKSCRYASWDENDVFIGCASPCGCQWISTSIEKMHKLLDETARTKFISEDARLGFRAAVSQCIKILENG